jgi:hypothetical protein
MLKGKMSDAESLFDPYPPGCRKPMEFKLQA